jgi:hypothetical protein
MSSRWLPWALLCCSACDPASPPPVAGIPALPRISEDDAEWTFRKILQRHGDYSRTPGRCGVVSSWTSFEYEGHYTEGRLFARAYPALAERLALGVLNDPEAPAVDQYYAWHVLSVLAPRSSPALEDFLAERATQTDPEDPWIENPALSNLAERRFDERCLALCRGLARKGDATALSLLTETLDPQAIALLQELTRRADNSSLSELAGQMLERIELLQSKEWEDRITRLLIGGPSAIYHFDFDWALAVARRRALRGLRAALETRLAPSRQARRSPAAWREWRIPPYYDQALVALMKAGGTLTPDEQKYLWQCGFLGDSEARLIEVLADRSKSRR